MNTLIEQRQQQSPIAWQQWNTQLVEHAQEAQKIIAVLCVSSLDYWSSQWLRELEADPVSSQALQDFFIPVLCAVEDHPDVAIRVQEVLAVTGSAASLPAIMWLTPDMHPIGAMPYQAPLDNSEPNALSGMLVRLADMWVNQQQDILLDVADMRPAWQYLSQILSQSSTQKVTLKKQLFIDGLEAHIMNMADPLEGGFGPAPRGNQVSILDFLLQRIERGSASASVRTQCEKTLQALLAGAIHDHFQGGFFRAVIDDAWNQVFFEKRLIDNTQLIQTFLRAADILEQPVYRSCALRIMEFCVHTFLQEDGRVCWGLHAESLGADAQMINGAAYLWSKQAVADIIGSEAADIIQRRFFCDDRSYIDQTFACAAVRGEINEQEQQQLPALCQRLAIARNERPQPSRDESNYIVAQAELCIALCAVLAATSDEHIRAPFITALDSVYAALQKIEINTETSFQDAIAVAQARLSWAAYNSHADNADENNARAQAQKITEHLQQRFHNNGAIAAVENSLLADPAFFSADSNDGNSPLSRYLAVCRQLAKHSSKWQAEAQRIIDNYQPLIKQAPLAHTSLIQEWELL